MGTRARIKDEVIARLTSNQKDIIANIFTTRQSLRQVQSQCIKLHQAIQAELAGSDKSKQSLRYEEYLRVHNDLAQRLRDDLERLKKRLADIEVAMERLEGPVKVEPWPEGHGASHAVVMEDINRFLNILYWFGVALAAVFVLVAVFSILFLAGGPDSRAAIREVAATEGYRGRFKLVWNEETIVVAKHRSRQSRVGHHRGPKHSAVADEETDELGSWITMETAWNSEASLPEVPAIASIEAWNAVKRQVEIQEREFLQYETGVRLVEGKIGPITWQEGEQFRLDWIRSRRRQWNNEKDVEVSLE
ncbi:uncharacterized protein LAJ45_00949 [Morchella importuna]|uniref:uncharacterized protein n=1 Tax=Morchella importuna TaxID=1174673 RepID=UPI001E8CE284|nr:uncharacterized protein LAJ45_00949 [Morchella importuna]KAH8154422.1 hypothetical protein LAJ45_00949 [Morchella importuna]